MSEIDLSLETLAWMGLRVAIPAHWELRRHGVDPDAGALVWVDRHAQRLELRWLRPKKEPDVTRMVEHARDALRDDPDGPHVSQLPSGLRPWEGLLHGENPRLCQAVAHFPEHNVLLQLTFRLDGNREEINRTLRQVLSSIQVEEAPESATRWRAFGIDCTVPPGWTFEGAKVLPMDARFRFTCPKRSRLQRQRASFEVRRLGMAREWFDGNLEEFAKTRALGPSPSLELPAGVDGGVFVQSALGRFPLLGSFGPKDREHMKIWHEPGQNAMFLLTHRNPRLTHASLEAARVQGVPVTAQPAPPPDANVTRDTPILEALPTRNESVQLVREGQGAVLNAKLRRRWWTRAPFTWFFPYRDQKGFGLDRFGLEVWESCDGNRTVESICEQFARRHDITFQEARVAVCQFLEALTKRDLVVMQVPKVCLEAS